MSTPLDKRPPFGRPFLAGGPAVPPGNSAALRSAARARGACRAALAAGISLSLLALTPATAEAGPCDDFSYGLGQGAAQSGVLDGDLGTARRLCGRTEFGVVGGLSLIADAANFYGRLKGGLTLDGSYAVHERIEIFASWEAFRYEQVLAPLGASFIGLGHFSLGGTGRFVDAEKATAGVTGRVVLPTTWLYKNARPIAWDVGVGVLGRVHPTVHLHAQVGLMASAAISAGAADPRAGFAGNFGVELRPLPALALVVDLQGNFGYQAPVEMVAAAIALRLSDRHRFGFELGATIPIAGRERNAVALDFRFTGRFGTFPPVPPATPPGGGS